MLKKLYLIAIAMMLAVAAQAQSLSVMDFGAKADGVADDTAAIQSALDAAAKAGGGIVNVPTGQYRLNGNIKIPGGVTLEGTYRVPPTNSHDGYPTLQGSVLLAYAGRGQAEGEPLIRLAGSMATLRGVIVSYPEWSQKDVPPVPYPATVKAEHNDNVGIIDCLFLNSYEAIYLDFAGRFIIRNVYGYPSYRGISVDQCYDIGRIENVHFWPFGVTYKADDPYCKWVNVNGIAFEFNRTDWQYVMNTFCFGYGVGYKFSERKAGGCNGNFVGLGADSCRRSVLVEQAQMPGLLITNGEFVGRWGSVDSIPLEIGDNVEGKVSLVNCSFWGPIDRCIWMHAPKGWLSASACHFVHWDNNQKNHAAIQVDSGKAIIQGNTFVEEKTHIQIGKDVRSAIIMGNQGDPGLVVDNQAGERTQMIGNEVDMFEMSDAAKANYRLNVGEPGDGRYAEGWNVAEKAGEWPDAGSKRWTMGNLTLTLPVLPGKAYDLAMDIYLPRYAIDENNGVLINGERNADLPQSEGTHLVKIAIQPQTGDTVTLTVKAKMWRGMDVIPGNIDSRQLGFGIRSLTMHAEGAEGQVYSANNGKVL